MRTFLDGAGRSWPVVINVAAAKRVRGTLGVDLYGLAEDGFRGLGELLADPVALVDLLYVLCRSEAEARGVSDEQFGAAFSGDVIEAAANAFLEEFADFFPNPRRRAAIRKLVATSGALGDRLMERAEADLDALDLDALTARLLGTSSGSSGGSPGSSGSTPAP